MLQINVSYGISFIYTVMCFLGVQSRCEQIIYGFLNNPNPENEFYQLPYRAKLALGRLSKAENPIVAATTTLQLAELSQPRSKGRADLFKQASAKYSNLVQSGKSPSSFPDFVLNLDPTLQVFFTKSEQTEQNNDAVNYYKAMDEYAKAKNYAELIPSEESVNSDTDGFVNNVNDAIKHLSVAFDNLAAIQTLRHENLESAINRFHGLTTKIGAYFDGFASQDEPDPYIFKDNDLFASMLSQRADNIMKNYFDINTVRKHYELSANEKIGENAHKTLALLVFMMQYPLIKKEDVARRQTIYNAIFDLNQGLPKKYSQELWKLPFNKKLTLSEPPRFNTKEEKQAVLKEVLLREGELNRFSGDFEHDFID